MLAAVGGEGGGWAAERDFKRRIARGEESIIRAYAREG